MTDAEYSALFGAACYCGGITVFLAGLALYVVFGPKK